MDRPGPSRSAGVLVAGSVALVFGIIALVVPPAPSRRELISWESLLAPYSGGAPLPGNFRVQGIQRGSANDVVVFVGRLEDTAAVEVHVVQRGRWTGVLESQSFGIAFEIPRSSAAEREEITQLLAEAIRSRDRGLPAPDAIPLHAASDSSVLPWWLETLRGGRGVLLGASLVLLALIALVPSSPGPGRAGLALGVTALVARVAGVPALPQSIGAPWTLAAAAVLLALAFRRQRLPAAADRWLALAIGAAALILRLALGLWGPLHVNGQGPHFVAGAARDPGAIAAYGPGYAEVFGPIAALTPSSPDSAIFASNALFSAFMAPLAFTLGRLMGVGRRAAVVAALILALDPVAIRMSATESYFPVISFLSASAAVILLRAVHDVGAGGRWRVVAGVGAAGLLLAQAARIHPSAWAVIAIVPFVTVAAASAPVRRRVILLLCSAAAVAGIVVATSGGVLLDVLGNIRGGTLIRPLPPPLWPLAWVSAAAIAYALVTRRSGLAVPAALCAAAMLMTRHIYGQSWIWQQSYDRLYLTLPLIALAAGLPAALWRRPRVALPLAALLGFTWFRFGLPIVVERTTDQHEYRWVHERLAELPPQCRVIYVASAGKRVVLLPTYAGPPTRQAVAMVSEPTEHDRRGPLSHPVPLLCAHVAVLQRRGPTGVRRNREPTDTRADRAGVLSGGSEQRVSLLRPRPGGNGDRARRRGGRPGDSVSGLCRGVGGRSVGGRGLPSRARNRRSGRLTKVRPPRLAAIGGTTRCGGARQSTADATSALVIGRSSAVPCSCA